MSLLSKQNQHFHVRFARQYRVRKQEEPTPAPKPTPASTVITTVGEEVPTADKNMTFVLTGENEVAVTGKKKVPKSKYKAYKKLFTKKICAKNVVLKKIKG